MTAPQSWQNLPLVPIDWREARVLLLAEAQQFAAEVPGMTIRGAVAYQQAWRRWGVSESVVMGVSDAE